MPIPTYLLPLTVLLLLECANAQESNEEFMSSGMTGTYLPLRPQVQNVKPAALSAALPTAEGTCPSSLHFQTFVFDGALRIAPHGLADPSGTCAPANDEKQPSLPLVAPTASRFSLLSLFSATRKLEYHAKMHSLQAHIPQTLLQCPNDRGLPFISVKLVPVKDFVIPMVASTLKEIGLPEAFVNNVFGGVENAITAKHPWFAENGASVRRKVNTLLTYLSKAYYLQLTRAKESASDSQLIAAAPPCSFLGGAVSLQDTKMHMQQLSSEIAPMVSNIEQAPLRFAPATHFRTNARCKASSDGLVMHSIRLNYTFPRKMSSGPYGRAALLPVSVDGNACASMRMYRFSEAEPQMGSSQTGRASRALARRVVTFLEKNLPSHTYNTAAQNRFASQFPAFERRLRRIRFKSALFVARLNISGCPGVTSIEPLDLLLVKKPTSFFYCNGFTDKELSISHPCFQHTVMKKWGLVAKEEETEKEREETTVFLSGRERSKSCIYSSSESVASGFRDVIFDVLESPEPSLEPSVEPMSEPSPAPAEPETVSVPITVPSSKRNKACFPAHAVVSLRSGRKVQMRHLRIGDEVEVSPSQFSPVILFSHATDAILSEMVTIATLSGTIAASGTHLLRVLGGHKAAAAVREGDALWVSRNGTLVVEAVRSVRRDLMRGLYNPHTKASTILVSIGSNEPVLASPYTTAVAPAAAHAALAPLRWAHSQLGITFPAVSRLFPDTAFTSTGAAHSDTREKIDVRTRASGACRGTREIAQVGGRFGGGTIGLWGAEGAFLLRDSFCSRLWQ